MPNITKNRIVHVTTVHSPWDNRIFVKMINSLLDNQYEVCLISKESNSFHHIKSGFTYIPLSNKPGLLARLIRIYRVFIILLRYFKGSIIHFHDPELLPICILLKLLKFKIIYDIHEDYTLAIMQKKHVPGILKKVVITIVWVLESIFYRLGYTIIAEKVYAKRFPKATEVLNYPVLTKNNFKRKFNRKLDSQEVNLLYTGTISEDRGAYLHLKLLKLLPQSRLSMIGKCSTELAEKLKLLAVQDSLKLSLYTTPQGLEFQRIIESYINNNWDFALAVFPDTPHYRNKELTKLFEYMEFGIPIVYSAFDTWEKLIGSAGLSVDPSNLERDVHNIQKISNDEAAWTKMSAYGRQIVGLRYDWQSQFRNLIHLYDQVSSK